MSEEEFYNHLSEVAKRIQSESYRHSLRWFLEKEGFSRWEVNAIERPIDFRQRKLERNERNKLRRTRRKSSNKNRKR